MLVRVGAHPHKPADRLDPTSRQLSHGLGLGIAPPSWQSRSRAGTLADPQATRVWSVWLHGRCASASGKAQVRTVQIGLARCARWTEPGRQTAAPCRARTRLAWATGGDVGPTTTPVQRCGLPPERPARGTHFISGRSPIAARCKAVRTTRPRCPSSNTGFLNAAQSSVAAGTKICWATCWRSVSASTLSIDCRTRKSRRIAKALRRRLMAWISLPARNAALASASVGSSGVGWSRDSRACPMAREASRSLLRRAKAWACSALAAQATSPQGLACFSTEAAPCKALSIWRRSTSTWTSRSLSMSRPASVPRVLLTRRSKPWWAAWKSRCRCAVSPRLRSRAAAIRHRAERHASPRRRHVEVSIQIDMM